MKSQSFKCCNCKSTFTSKYYNWYYYYSKGKFHECPECKSKLVPTYDFKWTGTLDKVSSWLFYLTVASGAVTSYFFGYETGALVCLVPAIAGAITSVMYQFSLIGADRDVQETRFLTIK